MHCIHHYLLRSNITPPPHHHPYYVTHPHSTDLEKNQEKARQISSGRIAGCYCQIRIDGYLIIGVNNFRGVELAVLRGVVSDCRGYIFI